VDVRNCIIQFPNWQFCEIFLAQQHLVSTSYCLLPSPHVAAWASMIIGRFVWRPDSETLCIMHPSVSNVLKCQLKTLLLNTGSSNASVVLQQFALQIDLLTFGVFSTDCVNWLHQLIKPTDRVSCDCMLDGVHARPDDPRYHQDETRHFTAVDVWCVLCSLHWWVAGISPRAAFCLLIPRPAAQLPSRPYSAGAFPQVEDHWTEM